MTWIREKNRHILYIGGLILYSLSVYLLFLVLTFPKVKVQRWFFIQFQKVLQSEMTVGESHFTFPLGTEWKQITIVPYGKTGPRLVLDQLNVEFLVSSLIFKRSLDAHFSVKGWGGEIRGVVGSDKGGGSSNYSVLLEADEIDLKDFPWGKGISLNGKIRFQTEYRWDEKNPIRGRGFLNFEGTEINGRGLSISGYTLPELTLFKVNGHGLIREGSVTWDRLNTTGSLADLNGSGTLLLELPLEKSLLNISMKLTPKEALNKVIPLAFLSPTARAGLPMDLFLKGTIKDPVFTLTGTPS
ncbi:MAG: type II secretion system protein GspN [Nitrospiria bacterium]